MNCPHCNESLPGVHDAFCPYCRNRLVDPEGRLSGETYASGNCLPETPYRKLSTDNALPLRNNVVFWISAWFGTALTGSLYGLVIGFIITIFTRGPEELLLGDLLLVLLLGIIVGGIYAAVVGAAIHLCVAFFMWFFWLSRYQFAAAALAGLLTGTVATLGVADLLTRGDILLSAVAVVTAGLLGAIGGGWSGVKYWRRGAPSEQPSQSSQGPWQFTLRDVFLRVTVVSVILAVGLAIARALLNP